VAVKKALEDFAMDNNGSSDSSVGQCWTTRVTTTTAAVAVDNGKQQQRRLGWTKTAAAEMD
jgi:hypothetical protein